MRRAIALTGLILALAASQRPGFAQVADPLPYSLVPDQSHWEFGCFGPCECPVIIQNLTGRFSLRPNGTDPLYSYYDLLGIQWSIAAPGGAIAVTGSGRYQLGGEFAVMHRLTLDLLVGGKPIHLDGGLIPGGGEWPEIKIDCPAHGNACSDTVAVIDARPGGATAGVGPGGASAALEARPNPFRLGTVIHITLASPGRADLRVFDVAGRLQRVLLSRQLVGAGDLPMAWDGRREDGSQAPPGLYLARLQTAAGLTWRRLVRLR